MYLLDGNVVEMTNLCWLIKICNTDATRIPFIRNKSCSSWRELKKKHFVSEFKIVNVACQLWYVVELCSVTTFVCVECKLFVVRTHSDVPSEHGYELGTQQISCVIVAASWHENDKQNQINWIQLFSFGALPHGPSPLTFNLSPSTANRHSVGTLYTGTNVSTHQERTRKPRDWIRGGNCWVRSGIIFNFSFCIVCKTYW